MFWQSLMNFALSCCRLLLSKLKQVPKKMQKDESISSSNFKNSLSFLNSHELKIDEMKPKVCSFITYMTVSEVCLTVFWSLANLGRPCVCVLAKNFSRRLHRINCMHKSRLSRTCKTNRDIDAG